MLRCKPAFLLVGFVPARSIERDTEFHSVHDARCKMSQNRSEDSKAFKKIHFEFGAYKLRYAWVSQRGYYPEDLDKHNQDAHVEVENFGKAQGLSDAAFFAVYDGHGKTGDHCAMFTRDKMPDMFVNQLVKVCHALQSRPLPLPRAREPRAIVYDCAPIGCAST